MARRKRPADESPDEANARRMLETVSDAATRSEKVSWDRKMDNMVSLLSQIKPIEDRILDAMAEKLPLLDKIDALRAELVKDCVHPYENLVIKPDNTIQCKFCMKNFRVLRRGRQK